jgi:hypothetical protein
LILALPVAAQETRASAVAKHDAEFAASDTNKDGFLTPKELVARMKRMKVSGREVDDTHARRLAALVMVRTAANGDGKVSKAESQAVMKRLFARYDLNGDGKVDGAEAAKARAAARAAAAAKPGSSKATGR